MVTTAVVHRTRTYTATTSKSQRPSSAYMAIVRRFYCYMCSLFGITPTCDRRADRRTDRHTTTAYTLRAVRTRQGLTESSSKIKFDRLSQQTASYILLTSGCRLNARRKHRHIAYTGTTLQSVRRYQIQVRLDVDEDCWRTTASEINVVLQHNHGKLQ